MSEHVHKVTLPSSSAPSACGKLSGLSAILEYPLFIRCFLLGGGCSGTLLLAGRLGGWKVRDVPTGAPTQQEIPHTTIALILRAWLGTTQIACIPEFSLFPVEGVRSCLAGGGLLVCLVGGGLLFCLLSDFSCSACVLVTGTLAGGDGVSLSTVCFCFVLRPSLPGGGACEVFFVCVLVRRVLAGILMAGGDGVSLSLGAMVCWCFCFVLRPSLPGEVFFVRVLVRRVLAPLFVWPGS